MAEKPQDIIQDEHNLKEYLQGDSALSKAYGAEEKAVAPAHLDNSILSAANEAVRPKRLSKIAYSPFARTWYVPASMAAILTLCVGLVFTIYKDSGQTLLTAPKSEFDIDVSTVPVETKKSIGQGETTGSAGEKYRKYKYEDEVMSMDAIPEANKSVPSSIGGYEVEEPELEKRPASKIFLREKVMEMEDAFQSEITDKHVPKNDTSDQTLSDSPYIPERRDDSGRLEAADVKKQKHLDADVLNNKLGEVDLEAGKNGVGARPDQEPRYRQTKETQPGQDEILQEKLSNGEALDGYMTIEGFSIPAQSMKDEIMMPELWLKQINDLWVSGDYERAKENLNQFFVTYPDYPIEKLKTILDPESGLMDYIQ